MSIPVARLRATGPFRLVRVVVSHGWFQTSPFDWDPLTSTLWRAEHLPGGVARIGVRPAPDGVEVVADHALRPADTAVVTARVRRMLCLDHPVRGLADAAGRVDIALGEGLRRARAGRFLAGTCLHEDAIKAVCATNTRWPQAVESINAVAGLGEGGAFPQPGAIARAGEDTLRRDARVGYRAASIVALDRLAADGSLDELEQGIPGLDGRGVVRLLATLPGIGPTTAGFLCLLLGRYDVVAVDSAVIRHATARWFAGRTPTAAEVMAKVNDAAPYAGLVLAWATMRAWQREEGLIPE